MSIPLSDNVRVGQQKPVEDKSFNGLTPYSSVAQANSLLPVAIRHLNLTVHITDPLDPTNAIEYWYKGGIANANLVPKTSSNIEYNSIVLTATTDDSIQDNRLIGVELTDLLRISGNNQIVTLFGEWGTTMDEITGTLTIPGFITTGTNFILDFNRNT